MKKILKPRCFYDFLTEKFFSNELLKFFQEKSKNMKNGISFKDGISRKSQGIIFPYKKAVDTIPHHDHHDNKYFIVDFYNEK